MTYRHGELIAAAALMVGIVATACSEGTKPRDTTTRAAAPEVPAATSYTPPAIDPPAPGPSGPVSFADGEAAYHAGNYVDATDVFTRYVEERPDNAWGHYMLGLSAWKGGDLAGAEAAFTRSLEIDPKHVKSLVNLSRVRLEADRADDALAMLVQASELEPDSSVVQRLLGRAYAMKGSFDDAVAAYEHALELDPKDGWSMNNLGLLFLEHGQAEDALPLLVQAVEIRNDVPAFHNNLGMALEHAGRFGEAAAAYGSALSADPGYEKAARNLARVEQVKEAPKEPLAREAPAAGAVEDASGPDSIDEAAEAIAETP